MVAFTEYRRVATVVVLFAAFAIGRRYEILPDLRRPAQVPPPEMRTPETLREHIVTFYFQGNGASRAQAASYSGPEGVKSLDEFGDTHHAISHDAPRLLHNAYPYLELNDVAYANVSTTWNPWHWLLVFVSWIKHWYLRIEKAPLYYNIMTNWNVGGFHDVSQHFNGVQNMLQNVSESKRVVLYGASRGAATTLISVSKMPKVMLERIDLVIVEAPFDSVPSVLSSSVTIPGMAQVQLFLLEWIGLYKSTQTSPIEAIETFPLHVPVAFVTSKPDKRVPIENTQRVIDKLRSRGHGKVYHLMLDHSPHSTMPVHHPDDQLRYYEFVHKLYEKHCSTKQ